MFCFFDSCSSYNHFLVLQSLRISKLGLIGFTGKKGVFTTAGGLKVVYLSGIELPDGSIIPQDHCFSEADIKSLVASVTNSGSKDFVGVDILLTSQWPKAVCTYGNAPVGLGLS